MLRNFSMLTLVALTLASCNQFRVNVTDSGLKYQLHEHDDNGRKAKVGDILSFHLVLKNSKDSVLRDTYKEMVPFKMPLQPAAYKGAFEEGLTMLAKGDSATFYVSADSLFAKAMQPMPPSIAKGSDLSFTVKMLNVQTPQEYQKTLELSQAKQKETDANLIAEYLTKNKLNAQRTPSGLAYAVTTPGSGPAPARGDSVRVRYTGRLLNGKVFDSNTADGIVFPVGMGWVISGLGRRHSATEKRRQGHARDSVAAGLRRAGRAGQHPAQLGAGLRRRIAGRAQRCPHAHGGDAEAAAVTSRFFRFPAPPFQSACRLERGRFGLA